LSQNKSPFEFIITRRRFLALGSIAACAAIFPESVLGSTALSRAERSLALYNTHTGEGLKTVYWSEGEYITESLGAINRILRDHRTDQIKDIDARLLDLLFALRSELEISQPFHVISGYRSAETNARLHAGSSGVAGNSLHVVGRAVDIRTPGTPLPVLRRAAVALKVGGVGYYPKSDFVHVDVGRVRTW
jgi:uncharacterized protein YcbK (DUF882 family)